MANQSIPVFQRQETVKTVSTPDFQSSTEALAASQNSLSAIGARVAQTASNRMATTLGYEQGKTPTGDLLPPITEFDKNFTASYETQADATLKLQAQKLLDNAEVEMSKPNRLSAQLIAKTHEQLQIGLNKIAEAAPTSIKGQLQAQFDSQLLNQTTQYQEKMIGEQREDQKNTLINGIDLATKNALEFAKSGNFKAADDAVANAKKLADNGSANKFLTPEQARIAHESVTQASLDGKYTHLAMQALNNKTYPEFEKHYSENKPAGMTNEQWLATGQAFNQQVTFIQSLRTQDENLKSQLMMNKIAAAPGLITPTEWTNFTNSVSPLKAAEVNFKYIQAMKASQSTGMSVDSLIQNWSNPEAQAIATDKIKNAAFLKQVDYTVQNSQKKLPEIKPISHEEAEVQVAAASPAPIPVFTDGLKYKIHSGNPAFIESAAQQIHSLEQMEAGHALQGLNDKDNALYTAYEAMRDSRDPATAARDATALVSQDKAVRDVNEEKFTTHLNDSIRSTSLSPTDFALKQFNLASKDFSNPGIAQTYGTDILNKYKSYYVLLGGDDNSARKLTQKYIDNNYGETGVNGSSYKTMHPLEQVLGFKNSDAVPYIQRDVITQISPKFAAIKKLYDDNKSNEYWETIPLSDKKHGIFSTTYDPIQVKRHMRTSSGVKTDTFNVVLQGNPFDTWDFSVQGETGINNIFQVAPYLGIIGYAPDANDIHANYNKDHKLK